MNLTVSSLFQSISWIHVIAISFQTLTATYGDLHERGKHPPFPPFSCTSDSGPHALNNGVLVFNQLNQTDTFTINSLTLNTA